jgi:hypothetical protein
MTDDDLLAEYLGAETDAARADAARRLSEHGIDAADFDFLPEWLGEPSQWEEPSAGLEDRIMAEVLADAQAGHAPVATSGVDELSERRARRAERTGGRWAPRVAGVAAAITVGVTLGRLSIGGPGFELQAALGATPAGADASATVKARNEDAGVRIELSTKGLADPPPGSIYEAWVTDGTIRIPIGTFSKGGKVVLWSGVSLSRYPTITVTLEPVDNDASSSGKVVLRGEVK